MSNPSDNKSRIVPLESFAGVADADVQAFLTQYPHPFLILETKEGDFGEAGFQTLATADVKEGMDTKKAEPEDLKKTISEEDTGNTTDLDIQARPKQPVGNKQHEEIKKKLDQARMVTYVCPLVKRDVNKFASMITLGRAANNDIRINLPSISKFHAYFTHVSSNDTWFIADANSSNGTFVNGEKLKGDRSRLKLMNGAAVRLGSDVTLRFFEAKSFYEFVRTRLGSRPKG